MSRSKKRKSPTRFVPRIVLGLSVACVVPACVAGCNPNIAVADVGFNSDAPYCCDSVAEVGFDVSVADTGFHNDAQPDRPDVGVADVGFGDAAREAGVADVAFGPG